MLLLVQSFCFFSAPGLYASRRGRRCVHSAVGGRVPWPCGNRRAGPTPGATPPPRPTPTRPNALPPASEPDATTDGSPTSGNPATGWPRPRPRGPDAAPLAEPARRAGPRGPGRRRKRTQQRGGVAGRVGDQGGGDGPFHAVELVIDGREGDRESGGVVTEGGVDGGLVTAADIEGQLDQWTEEKGFLVPGLRGGANNASKRDGGRSRSRIR
jgi:hypothetical protein